MHPKKVENILGLSPEERVDYFIRYCADWEEVWGLSIDDSEWLIFKDCDGDEVFPVWPSKEFAELCVFSEHEELGAKPQAIELTVFIKEFLDDQELSKIYFGVFFNKNREGLILEAASLKKELEKELTNYS